MSNNIVKFPNMQKFGNLWTPALIAKEAWYDAADAATIAESSNKVSQWNDKSGNGRHATQAIGSRQPTYTASDSVANNKPSIGSTTNLGLTGLNTPSFGAKEIYAVIYYKDGVDAAFDFYNTIISNGSGVRPYRVLGELSLDSWLKNADFFNDNTYKNAVLTNTALPMPLSMFRFSSNTLRTQEWALGYNLEITDRVWQGAYCEFIFLAGTETTETRQKIEGYLAWKWGLEGDLPADHPYKKFRPVQ